MKFCRFGETAFKFVFSWPLLIFKCFFHQQKVLARYSSLRSWFSWCYITSNLPHTSIPGMQNFPKDKLTTSGYHIIITVTTVILLLSLKGQSKKLILMPTSKICKKTKRWSRSRALMRFIFLFSLSLSLLPCSLGKKKKVKAVTQTTESGDRFYPRFIFRNHTVGWIPLEAMNVEYTMNTPGSNELLYMPRWRTGISYRAWTFEPQSWLYLSKRARSARSTSISEGYCNGCHQAQEESNFIFLC